MRDGDGHLFVDAPGSAVNMGAVPVEEAMAIDEATAGFLTQLAASGAKPLHEMTPEEARGFTAALSTLFGPGPDVMKSYDVLVPTPDGYHITVRVLVPEGEIRALVVHYHGGGWVIGNIDESDHLTRILANNLKAAVVNVDYRLAPEHPYPAAANDAWTALQWANEHMTEIAGAVVPWWSWVTAQAATCRRSWRRKQRRPVLRSQARCSSTR